MKLIHMTARGDQMGGFMMREEQFTVFKEEIATNMDGEFARYYAKWKNCRTKAQKDKHLAIAEKIVDKKGLQKRYGDILEFLYSEPIKGELSFRACRRLHELVRNITGDTDFQKMAYAEYKDFLMECYSHKRNMIWNIERIEERDGRI